MSQYIISPEAIRDLDEIADYFVARNVEAGERFLDEFTKKCRYSAANLYSMLGVVRPIAIRIGLPDRIWNGMYRCLNLWRE